MSAEADDTDALHGVIPGGVIPTGASSSQYRMAEGQIPAVTERNSTPRLAQVLDEEMEEPGLPSSDSSAAGPSTPGSHRQPSAGADRVLVAIAAVLRGPIVALAPVLHIARADLDLSNAAVAWLVALPVLCFGVFSIPAGWVVTRVGTRASLLVSLAGIGVGMLVRIVPGFTAAMAGTFILGVAITVANVAIPAVAHTRGRRAGQRLTTRYVTVMNLVSLLATIATAPLAALTSWQTAITVPYAAMAGVLFLLVVRLPKLHPDKAVDLGSTELVRPIGPAAEPGVMLASGPQQDRERVDPRGKARIWLVSLLLASAFAGQTMSYYGITSWLPSQLDEVLGGGMVLAGVAAAVFQVSGVVGPFLLHLLQGRVTSIVCFLLVGALWLCFPVGMLSAPQGWWAWGVAAGLAQGATFTLVLNCISEVSTSQPQARFISSVVQSGGYAVGAAGPVVLGSLHDVAGSWVPPMLVVAGAAVLIPACGITALRVSRGSGAGADSR